MDTTPFVIERTLNAPVHRVWEALTNRDKMAKWYFELDRFEVVVGFEFSFTGGSEQQTYVHLCRITAVEFEKKLSYTWRYEGYAGNSEVIFELVADGDKTRLKLTHEGLHTFAGNGSDFTKESFAGGWTELVGNLLKQYVEAI